MSIINPSPYLIELGSVLRFIEGLVVGHTLVFAFVVSSAIIDTSGPLNALIAGIFHLGFVWIEYVFRMTNATYLAFYLHGCVFVAEQGLLAIILCANFEVGILGKSWMAVQIAFQCFLVVNIIWPYMTTVRGYSMSPWSPAWCVVIQTVLPDPASLKVGDVVSFKSPPKSNVPCCNCGKLFRTYVTGYTRHRIIKELDGKILTQGDNNADADGWIDRRDVLARHIARISPYFIGWIYARYVRLLYLHQRHILRHKHVNESFVMYNTTGLPFCERCSSSK
jgi:hypothetical protein